MSLDGLKFLGIGLACIVTASAAAAITPEERCEADKHKIAGRYAFCRQRVEFKAIKSGASPDFSKCDLKLIKKWSKAEEKAINAGTTCMDGVSDTDIQSFVTAHADAITAALGGGNLPECGDGSVNVVGEQCDGADLGGESCTTLGFDGGALACDGSCGFDTSGCDSVAAPATGETTAFGAGSDGDVQAGADLSYTDNGDGTITDNNTGLMWEKKDDSGGIHDMDNAYTWSTGPPWEMDGTITTVFLAALNRGQAQRPRSGGPFDRRGTHRGGPPRRRRGVARVVHTVAAVGVAVRLQPGAGHPCRGGRNQRSHDGLGPQCRPHRQRRPAGGRVAAQRGPQQGG